MRASWAVGCTGLWDLRELCREPPLTSIRSAAVEAQLSCKHPKAPLDAYRGLRCAAPRSPMLTMQYAQQREADIATPASAGMDAVGALVCLPGHGLKDT